MNTLHTWNLVIDGTEVVIQGLTDGSIMMDYPRIDDSIFTAYNQEDFLVCTLLEGGGLADGTVLEFAVIDEGDGDLRLTWDDGTYTDSPFRAFTLEVKSLVKTEV